MAIVEASFYAGAAASLAGGGSPWGTPDKAAGAPDATATQARAIAGDPTNWLRLYSFGATIPDGATVLGHLVELYKKQAVAVPPYSCKDLLVRVYNGVALIGQNKADLISEWPVALDPPTAYGALDDLWGLGLTPAQYRAADFGLVVQADFDGANSKALVDAIRWTVRYDDGLGSPRRWWAAASHWWRA